MRTLAEALLALLLATVIAAPGAAAESEFGYRVLQIQDFKAAAQPTDSPLHGGRLDAVSCLRVVWPAGMEIETIRIGAAVASLSLTSPKFHAAFDTTCSWMRSGVSDHAYVLAHEQVHFAIGEAAARDLTESMHDEAVYGRGSNRAEATQRIMSELRRLANRAMKKAKKVHLEFDGETRNDASAEVQSRWLRKHKPAT